MKRMLFFMIAALGAPHYALCMTEADKLLHQGMAEGSTKKMWQAIEEKANVHSIDPVSGYTVVHKAVLKQKPELLELALNLGGNPNQQDPKGNAPLHLLAQMTPDCSKCNAKVVQCTELLIRKRADVQLHNGNNEKPEDIAVMLNNSCHVDNGQFITLVKHGEEWNNYWWIKRKLLLSGLMPTK